MTLSLSLRLYDKRNDICDHLKKLKLEFIKILKVSLANRKLYLRSLDSCA